MKKPQISIEYHIICVTSLILFLLYALSYLLDIYIFFLLKLWENKSLQLLWNTKQCFSYCRSRLTVWVRQRLSAAKKLKSGRYESDTSNLWRHKGVVVPGCFTHTGSRLSWSLKNPQPALALCFSPLVYIEVIYLPWKEKCIFLLIVLSSRIQSE